ncbi:tetratricopeptide repeat protein [Limibacter armeniacum]|uniref:tetratricopeptide repeat protein n=1 Tax=Limibacter armeniacum TaxID=466084 RepID=UPI002FE62488
MNSEYQKALELCQQEKYQEAIGYFDKAIKRSPRHFEAYYNRSAAKYRLMDFEGALSDIGLALKIAPQSADAWSHKGVVTHMSGKSHESLTDFDRAQELEPNNPYRYSSRAFIKAHIKDVAGAMEDYKKALELDPEDAISLNNLGMLEEQAGRVEAAQKRFKKADDLVRKDDEQLERPDLDEMLKEWRKEKEVTASKSATANIQQTKTVQVETAPPKAKDYVHVVKEVLTNKEMFREFVKFILNGFKLK